MSPDSDLLFSFLRAFGIRTSSHRAWCLLDDHSVTAYALHAYAQKLSQEYAWTSVAPVENTESGPRSPSSSSSPYTHSKSKTNSNSDFNTNSPYTSETKHLLDDSSSASASASGGQRESTFSFHLTLNQLQQHLPALSPPHLHLHRHQKTDSDGSNASGSDGLEGSGQGQWQGYGRVSGDVSRNRESFAFVGYENVPPSSHHDVDIDIEHHQGPHGRISSEETLLNPHPHPHPHAHAHGSTTTKEDAGDSSEDSDMGADRAPFESLSFPRNKERDLNRMSSYESYEDPYYRSS